MSERHRSPVTTIGNGVVEKPRTHKDVEVWRQSMDLVDTIYRITRTFPTEEMYGLSSQMRRAAVSIPSNIAEGAARSGRRQFSQFLHVALGSLSELETQLLITERLTYINRAGPILQQVETMRRLLLGLIRHLKRDVK